MLAACLAANFGQSNVDNLRAGDIPFKSSVHVQALTQSKDRHKELGPTIPPTLLAHADEVIE